MSSGRRLFAQYAHAPNALGYCGPPGSEALEAVACGSGGDVDVRAIARRFSGAWPYQELIGTLTVKDPLDHEVVRGYWTGNDLTAGLDRDVFGKALLDRLAPQAGHYWAHLTEDLLPEAAPTHAFHVFGVYPWSRLLEAGPEPLHVLDSCRIGWGTVLAVEPDHLRVAARQLEYDDRVLTLGNARERRVDRLAGGLPFIDQVAEGDVVALHWGFACDRLTPAEATHLEDSTRRQLALMAPRLAG
ncbi:DUF6390 family protein [Cryptosporangium sp. NPDC051539]|uniref:DUF6390 family protein n=1 Tax=Cryptosporangium sp. NPDC051539 TaxID=3363962 RepID=UPI0037A2B35B